MGKKQNSMVDSSGGVRADRAKPQVNSGVFEYFPEAIEIVARVSEYGTTKYGIELSAKNWRKLDSAIERIENSLARHVIRPSRRLDESGLPHIAHVAWNALAILQLIIEEKEK